MLPERLLLVRHGESAGNVARDKAEAAGLALIDIAERDMDVTLSPQGEEQAAALGTWLGDLRADEQPTTVLTSPYVRAVMTAHIALDAAGLRDRTEVAIDERLREREFGVLDRLTKSGILERFPEEAERRGHVGKFYHRPPGGESWCDVALRVRSVVDSITREPDGARILVVAHQVVILMFRYVLEKLTEGEILSIDREAELANCSVGVYVNTGDGTMKRILWNHAAPVAESGVSVTAEPDVPVAPR
jgi:broad specificity phosphatase PhoE